MFATRRRGGGGRRWQTRSAARERKQMHREQGGLVPRRNDSSGRRVETLGDVEALSWRDTPVQLASPVHAVTMVPVCCVRVRAAVEAQVSRDGEIGVNLGDGMLCHCILCGCSVV